MQPSPRPPKPSDLPARAEEKQDASATRKNKFFEEILDPALDPDLAEKVMTVLRIENGHRTTNLKYYSNLPRAEEKVKGR